jgi:hypothetical protein
VPPYFLFFEDAAKGGTDAAKQMVKKGKTKMDVGQAKEILNIEGIHSLEAIHEVNCKLSPFSLRVLRCIHIAHCCRTVGVSNRPWST